jgi:sRNA-binding protein
LDKDNNLLLQQLVHVFPGALAPRGQACWPLKIGIDQDLIALLPKLSPWRVSAFLCWYTKAPRYHLAMIAGGPRRDLFGEAAGEVTPGERAYAVACLAAIHARGRSTYKASLASSPPIVTA